MTAAPALPRCLWFLVAGTTLTKAGAFVFPYLTIYLSQARGLGLPIVGTVLAVGGAGLVVGNVTGGWAADRIGRKPTLLAALVINAVGFLALSQPDATPATYATWLAVGYVGTGMYGPAAAAVVSDETPPASRSRAYAALYVGGNVGMAVGPLLGGILAQTAYGWLFIGDAATTLACAGLIAVGVPWRSPPRDTRRVEGHIAVWRAYPRVLAFAAASVFLVAPLMGLEYAVPLLVARTFAADLVWVGAIYTINAVTVLSLGMVVERWLRGRSDAWAMVLASGLWTAGLLIAAVGRSLPALVGCTLVWTLGEIIASIVVPSHIAARVPARVKGRMLAIADVARSAAGMTAPVVLGVTWARWGVDVALGLLVALPLIGGSLYLFAARRAKASR
ncbi:MAG: MFS transporter [Deltaproteobacteria bacterium]|nr:MFS transporter [Deltaproteobacteria bacterium]